MAHVLGDYSDEEGYVDKMVLDTMKYCMMCADTADTEWGSLDRGNRERSSDLLHPWSILKCGGEVEIKEEVGKRFYNHPYYTTKIVLFFAMWAEGRTLY